MDVHVFKRNILEQDFGQPVQSGQIGTFPVDDNVVYFDHHIVSQEIVQELCIVARDGSEEFGSFVSSELTIPPVQLSAVDIVN